MKKETLLERFKRFLGSIGWTLFIWGNDFTQEEYWERIYRQEKKHKEELQSEVVLLDGFYITDFCKCKCGADVSPSESDTILYDDKREKIIGFECWKCGEWVAFPKICWYGR